MWDVYLITFGVGFVVGFIGTLCLAIPVVGPIVNVITSIIVIAMRIYWGVNGKYYLRLRRQHGISFLKALKAQKKRNYLGKLGAVANRLEIIYFVIALFICKFLVLSSKIQQIFCR